MNKVSINNNERQSKNKNRALHFAESKTFREQMEEIVATTEGTKTKTLPKGRTSSPSDGTIFQEVWIEKMEQHNSTLLNACKIWKKWSELDTIYIKSISYGRADDEQKYTTLLRKLHSQNCDFGSQMSDLIFKIV